MKPFKETVEPILKHVGELVLQLRKEGLHVENKADGTLVTNADKAASDIIIAALSAAYPGMGIVSEEHPDVSGVGSEYTWVIDPIDGTKHYATGGSLFNIMVCLFDDRPLFAMVYYPVLGRWYWAERGKGSFIREKGKTTRLQLRSPREPFNIVYGPGCPHEIGEQGSLGIGKYFSKIWHGKRDAFLRVDVPYWDLLPPTLILQEAGGVVKDFSGNDITFAHLDARQPEIIAGHPIVVDSILKQIRA